MLEMPGDVEETALLGLTEWLIIGVVVFAVYLYRTFNHLLPSTVRSSENASATSSTRGQPGANDEDERRRSMMEARRRLIEESEKKIDENREKLKELEEKKEREKRERAEKLLDHSKKTSSSSGAFRKDYNPLMGDGGSCSWRPTKRSSARGG